MRSIKRGKFKGKMVLVRVDFNVPIKNNKVTDSTRIEKALPTIKFLLKSAKKVILLSHLGRPNGKQNSMRLDPVAKVLKKHFSLKKLDDCINVKPQIMKAKEKLILLENVRFYKEEKTNNSSFAKKLANQADIFVNDAFSNCHRKHASIVGITKYLPSYAGLLLENEVKSLSALLRPKKPYIAILGGAKVSDKIKLIKNLLKKVDTILIGGAMAFSFYKDIGVETGRSLTEKAKVAKLLKSKKIILPTDIVCDNRKVYAWNRIPESRSGLDIGPETANIYSEIIKEAKTVFWNGPLGVFEKKPFDKGSRIIAKAVEKNKGLTVVGGGDTVAALNKFKIKRISHISTGGGASLEFLEGKKLPGIRALEAFKY